MLRDTWALVGVRNGQTFQSNWRWAECVTLSFLEAFPHFGCRFLGGTTLFVLLFPQTYGKMNLHCSGRSKCPRSGTFPRNTTTTTMCYMNHTLTLYYYLPSLSMQPSVKLLWLMDHRA